MNRPDARAVATAVLAAKQRVKMGPIAYARLWHVPPSEAGSSSQRDAVRAMLTADPDVLYAFMLGGHRAGKSDAGAQMDVALALGSAHPWVQAWLEGNGLPLDCIPPEPSTVWCVSPDSNDSIRFVRPKLARYLGASAEWKNREGNGEAKATIETERGVATWWFKSVDQHRDGFQGDAVRAVSFDEEPLDYDVVEESSYRVVDLHGRLYFRMTPLYGWTRLLGERVRNPQSDTVVRYISGVDNPHVDQHALRRAHASTSSHLKSARMHGRITSAEGLVYPMFDRAKHLVRAHAVDAKWRRFLSIDFGTRNPASWHEYALDSKDNVLHVTREHFVAGLTIKQHVAVFTGIDVDDPELTSKARRYFAQRNYEVAVADPEDKQARMQLEDEYGLETTAANKDIRAGIDAMSERLALDANGNPGMLVHDCCSHFVEEIEGYRWPKSTLSSSGDREQPVKRDDHAMDDARYLCLYLKTHDARDEYAVASPLGVGESYWR